VGVNNQGEGTKKKQLSSLLSFTEQEEDEDALEVQVTKKRCFGRNPDVNTGFLSGSQAEKAEESVALKRKLIEEYLEKQAREK
jgi:hypothetical protein